ncbi:MAG: PQQ-binding-like beta-propeller repeat protein [Firmicutes bacterium]|nr:PQQ-binding-like beta-propeller repeat protein [Candidatus Fermentithermobacillaceae bacterium]
MPLILTCLFLTFAFFAVTLRLRSPGDAHLEVAWEIPFGRPLAVSDEKILVANNGDHVAARSVRIVDTSTGAASTLPVPVPDHASPAGPGIAWTEGEILTFIDKDGQQATVPVPPESSPLTAFERAGSTWLVIGHPKLHGEESWSGAWTLTCRSIQGPSWSISLPGIPVLARAGTAGLLVGVTDLAVGPTSRVYLLSPDTGQVLWRMELGPGFFRETEFLPSGEILVSWSRGVTVLSFRGEHLCMYQSKGTVVSAAADAGRIYVIEARTEADSRAHLKAVSRDGCTVWQRRVSLPGAVRVRGQTVLCHQMQKVRAFSAHSGEEIWYYETGKGTTWLLDSGVLWWDGQILKLLKYRPGPD